jgi:leader peptidase (prepilin peptidase)/N-methyltransferase
MVVPDWIWFVFIFAFGSCIGSFLNVVIYRLPRDKSIVSPPSACPSCGRHIRFYDNIPLISWLILERKCRYCKAPISARYFVIELLTGIVFLGLFILYFRTDVRPTIPLFSRGGWFIYLLNIILLGAFIAASAIDLELWIIPLSICWLVTAAGFIGSAVGVFIIDPATIRNNGLLPVASPAAGALTVGAAVGLAVSFVLIATGLVKRSYDSQDVPAEKNAEGEKSETKNEATETPQLPPEDNFNHRLEAFREILFLLPIIIFAFGAYWLFNRFESIRTWWMDFSQYPIIAGLLGSTWGYFIGCGIVWGIRIFGTLGFGKEAMGLGDVHLMGAAGAVIGPIFVVLAFFIAPFFGLAWAGFNMFFKKIRQIPYGPFLSLAVFVVMILHDWLIEHLFVFYY